eukprot:SAG31_NODE_31774_length_364_cov_0.939623_1_plen_44_part_10
MHELYYQHPLWHRHDPYNDLAYQSKSEIIRQVVDGLRCACHRMH